MKKKRNQYAPEEKVAILRRHLLEKEPLSKLFDEVELQRRENSGKFVGSGPREERRGPVSEHPKHRMKWIIWKWKFAESLADALSPLSSSERRRLSATAFIAARHERSLKAECHRLEINCHGRELQQQIAAGIADATLASNRGYALKSNLRGAEKHTLRADSERDFRQFESIERSCPANASDVLGRPLRRADDAFELGGKVLVEVGRICTRVERHQDRLP